MGTARRGGRRAGKAQSPLVSLCLIVRDEEERLAACLESAAPWVDEMVVCDTGSTDRTVELARSLGARVVSFAWCDDFAAARNAALSQARGSWVLSLDADEVLASGSGPALRRLTTARPDSPRIFQALVRHFHDPRDPSRRTEQFFGRLFTRQPEIGWVSPIHEYLTWLGPADQAQRLRISRAPELAIDHSGHQHRLRDAYRKAERNMALLRGAMSRWPGDSYYPFKLAQHELELGHWSAAAELACRAVELSSAAGSWPEWAAQAYLCLAAARVASGELALAGAACEEGRRLFPQSGGLAYQLGTVRLLEGRLDEAETSYRAALSLGDAAQDDPDPGMTGWRPLHGLGGLCELRGDAEAAEAWYRQARTAAPGNGEAGLALADLLLRTGREADAEHELQAFLDERQRLGGEPDDFDDRALAMLAAALARQLPHPSAATLEQVVARARSSAAFKLARAKLGQLACDSGDADDALQLLAGDLDDPHAPAETYEALARALTLLHRAEDARNAAAIARIKRQPAGSPALAAGGA